MTGSYNRILALGSDTVLYVNQGALQRVDSTGTSVWGPEQVFRTGSAYAVRLLAQGGDAVVAWVSALSLDQPGLGAARVHMTP
jgi:hypothetical protein